jgi:hypothetical protein
VLTTHSARPPVGAAAKPRTPAVPHWSRCTAGLVHTRGPVLPEHEGCSMRVVRDRVGGDSTNDLPPNRSRPARPGLDREGYRIIWHNTTTMHACVARPPTSHITTGQQAHCVGVSCRPSLPGQRPINAPRVV